MVIELLTAALVLITGFYAWVTFRIHRANEKVVDAMREQALAVSRPYIIVVPFLELDNPIFYLRIANVGRTAATNLRLTIDKSFQQFGESGKEKDLSTFVAFNQIIGSFSPGAEIIFPLAQGAKVFNHVEEQSELPRTFSITAEYTFADKRVAEINRIDLRPYLKAGIPQDAYVRKLESIRKSLEVIATHVKNTSFKRLGLVLPSGSRCQSPLNKSQALPGYIVLPLHHAEIPRFNMMLYVVDCSASIFLPPEESK